MECDPIHRRVWIPLNWGRAPRMSQNTTNTNKARTTGARWLEMEVPSVIELDLSVLGGRLGTARKYGLPENDLNRQVAFARIHKYMRKQLRDVSPLTDEEIAELFAVLCGAA